jgi:hypothetical protein
MKQLQTELPKVFRMDLPGLSGARGVLYLTTITSASPINDLSPKTIYSNFFDLRFYLPNLENAYLSLSNAVLLERIVSPC